jgi:tetrahydromethanopterin S-methyltransferase subunit B
MNEDTIFILERMDKLREEFKEDLEKALDPVRTTQDKHEKKIEHFERLEQRIIGMALVVSALVSMIAKHF